MIAKVTKAERKIQDLEQRMRRLEKRCTDYEYLILELAHRVDPKSRLGLHKSFIHFIMEGKQGDGHER